MLASTKKLAEGVRADLESYEIANATERVRQFLDLLTNWYVRTSRDRFWAGDTGEIGHPEAFNTLYTVLETLCRISAPLLPMTTEVIWRGLTGECSVHLADFPDAADLPADDDLVASMDAVRGVCSAASSLA